MKKNRVMVWLIVGSVVVLGGFAFFAFRLAPRDDAGPYADAVDELRSHYGGPTKFIVSAREDARTRIERTPEGYAVHGVFQTDHPDLAAVTRQSPTGEIAFTVTMFVRPHWSGIGRSYDLDRFHFESVK